MVTRAQILVLCCAFTVACGHGSSQTAPSLTSLPGAGSSPVSGGAAINGTVVTNVASSAFGAESVGLTVTVVGSTISATVDGRGQFTLQGVPTGTPQLRFTGSGIDATIRIEDVGEHDEIRITVRLSGGTAEIETNRHDKPDHRVELEGKLTEVNMAARTLRVSDTLVNVPVGTPIRHGDTSIAFTALHVGDRVHVKGTATGAAVTATEVKVQNAAGNPGKPDDGDDDDDDDEKGEVELKGMLTGLGGTCPSITFTVSGTPVATNATTKFEDGACSTLKNGNTVEVEGTKQASGTVLATKVEKKK